MLFVDLHFLIINLRYLESFISFSCHSCGAFVSRRNAMWSFWVTRSHHSSVANVTIFVIKLALINNCFSQKRVFSCLFVCVTIKKFQISVHQLEHLFYLFIFIRCYFDPPDVTQTEDNHKYLLFMFCRTFFNYWVIIYIRPRNSRLASCMAK